MDAQISLWVIIKIFRRPEAPPRHVFQWGRAGRGQEDAPHRQGAGPHLHGQVQPLNSQSDNLASHLSYAYIPCNFSAY